MNSIDYIIRIIAESREQLRSEFEKPSNPTWANKSCRRSAMSDERTIGNLLGIRLIFVDLIMLMAGSLDGKGLERGP
jgi:hypothetical protein